MDDEEDNEVGSPSPPYEGVIREEAEKQLESNVGEFEAAQATNGKADDVNCFLYIFSTKAFKSSSLKLPQSFQAKSCAVFL